MKWKTTLVLVILVALGGAYIHFVEKGKKTTDEYKEWSKKLVPDFKTENAQRVELTRGQEKFVFERVDKENWRMVEPISVRADRTTVEGALDNIQFATKQTTISAKDGQPVDLEQYGCKEPQATLFVKMKDGVTEGPKEILVKVGKKASVGYNAYVMLGSDPNVYAVSDSIADKVTKKLNEWRDKRIAAAEKNDVTKVDILAAKTEEQPELRVTLAKQDGKWMMSQPVADRADADKVGKVVQKLIDARIGDEDFVTEDDSDLVKYGLDNPTLTFTVSVPVKETDKPKDEKTPAEPAASAEKSYTLIIGAKAEGKDGKLYAKLKEEKSIFAVSEALKTDLSPKPEDLRDRRLARFEADSVMRIDLVRADGTFSVLRKDKDSPWTFKDVSDIQAESSALKDFLENLGTFEIAEFVQDAPKDLAEYGLDSKSAVEMQLVGAEEKTVERVMVGKANEAGDKLYAKRADQAAVYAVPAGDAVDGILKPRLAFRFRNVLNVVKTDIRSFTLKRGDKTFECVRSEANETDWTLKNPGSGATDTWNVSDLLNSASNLTAKKFVEENPQDLAKYGLDKPEISLRLAYMEEVPAKPEDKPADAKPADAKPEDKPAEPKAEEKKEGEKPADAAEAKKPEKKEATAVLLVGRKEKDDGTVSTRYAMIEGRPMVFTIDDTVVNRLEAELGSTNISRIERDDVNKLIVSKGDVTVRYEKKDNKWVKLEGEQAADADVAPIDALLNMLASFNGSGIAAYSQTDLAAYGLDAPQMTLTIGRKAVSEVFIKVGKEDGDRYAVTGPSSSYILWSPDTSVAKIQALLPKPPEPEKPAEGTAPPAEGAAAPAERAPAPAVPAGGDKPAEQPVEEKKP
ncbi:MAG TPA: DUF4340 domain-containing protein [Candidatus Brocadiia bacterium]|nr:DUF4340 domain-containing protein [Candidatus Brocadiia bacterium]